MSFKTSLITFWLYKSNFSQFHHSIPVFIFPDAEPFYQILGALEFGVKAIFLPFESGHILHRHAEKKGETKENIKESQVIWHHLGLLKSPPLFGTSRYLKRSVNWMEKRGLTCFRTSVALLPRTALCDSLKQKSPCYLARSAAAALPQNNVATKLIGRHSACLVAYSSRNKRKVRKKHTHTPSGPLHPVTPSKHQRAIIVTGSDFKRKRFDSW